MVTREQIEWAYRVILGRDPQSENEYVWHSQYADFDELRRNIICSDEGSANLRRQLGPVDGDQPYDSLLEEPRDGRIKKRIAYFSGFVQSSEPLPPIKIIFDSKSQEWLKTWPSFNIDAPWNRRFTTHWSFRRETPVEHSYSRRQLVLEVFAGSKLVGSHILTPKRERTIFKARQSAPVLYFIHIEKTAGTSLRAIIGEGGQANLFVYNHIDFLPEEICRKFSRAALNEIDIVFGHFPFGLHKCFDRQYSYASVIRRPVDLVKSYYLFVKYVSEERKFAACDSIYDAIDRVGDRVFDNILVRYFSGNFSARQIGKDDFDLAVKNIGEHFSLIGLSEEFDKSADMLCRRLNIPFVQSYENKTPPTEESETIDVARLQRYLGDRVDWDFRLYDLIAERWYAARVV